jgi:Sec-independent protein translocase protein TatA
LIILVLHIPQQEGKMDSTYGEFQGTELDPALDFDFDDDEENDIVPIVGLAALLAAIVGAVLVLFGRRKEPTVAERAQEILDRAGKEGKKTMKTASKAVEDVRLGDLLEDALDKARKAGSDAGLVDLLTQAQKKARGLDAGELVSRGEAAATGLSSLLGDALDRARDASRRIDVSGLDGRARDVRKRAGKAAAAVRAGAADIDTDKANRFLEDLREKVMETIESVRTDVAPRAADTLRSGVLPAVQETAQTVAHRVQEDVVPAAQGAVEKLRDEVLPAAQERASKLAGEYEVGSRARKAASAATEGAGTLNNVLRGVAMAVLQRVLEDVLPEAKKVGSKAVSKAREDVIPAAAGTAGEAVHRVREDVLPRVGEAAAQTPGMLADILDMARERVSEAIDKAQPVVAGAAGSAASAASAAAGAATGAAHGGKRGVTGAVSSARKGVSGAVGGAVDATTYAARETTRILFWLSMLGAVILLVFVPDRERQEELWNNIRQFLGEVREMWRDLQGTDYDLDTTGETPTA